MGAACSSNNTASPALHTQKAGPQTPAQPDTKPQTPAQPKNASEQLQQDDAQGAVGPPAPSPMVAEVKQDDRPKVIQARPGQPVEGAKTEGASWRDLLTSLSKEDPWGGGARREARPYWTGLLEEAQALVRTPRRQLSQDLTLAALRGDAPPGGDQPAVTGRRSRVTIFVSSTFTDTQAERNLLMRDVYPYVRKLCQYLDLDFGTVDMRWGVKEELTMEHGTTQMCISEVKRCLRESAGPAFMAILGHKYGYRTLPVEIDKNEFEKLISLLKAQSEDTSIISDFYALDTNALSPEYVLQPRKADDSDWWNREKKIIALFRKVAEQLEPKAAEKYFISITEKEVKYGFLDNPLHQEQVICLKRQLNHVDDERHLHRHIIDMKDGSIDNDAQKYLETLKSEKINQVSGTEDVILDFDYSKDEIDACREYIVNTCDKVCEHVSRKILEAYKTHHHVEKDLVYDEVVQHQEFAVQKTDNFVGREDLINAITTQVTQSLGQESKVLGVYGTSGCGKTSLMAVVAKRVKESLIPKATLVLRFLGTTGQSGSIRAALYSVCIQLARVYGKTISVVPRGYNDLITYFQEALNFSTADQPIIIFLDSLDQLSNEDFGQNLKWLCLAQNLPPHTSIIVSTIPGGCLNALKAHLPHDKLIHVPNMTPADGPLLLDQMLAAQGRTVTPSQRQILLDAFAKCPLPLFFRLAVDIAIKWHSYDVIAKDEIADDMPGLISLLFEQLESRFGAMFVQHALAYVTCARDGLSVGELEDILSCDDEVLDYLFDYWLPPFRRIPQLLWIRVRNELGSYLMERGTNGVNAYGWYHRQFWETAANRYLDNEAGFRTQAHSALADYFEGKWADGKLWTPRKKTRAITDLSPRMEDRQVPRQPLVLSGSRGTGRQLGRRKLAELPHHLLALRDWDRLEQLVTTLPFVEAKFEAGQGYECRSFFLKAADQSGRKSVKAMSKFVGLGLPHFLAEPESIYQVASQQAQGNPIKAMFEAEEKAGMTRHFSFDQQQTLVDDPCEMTMVGHTSGVRCARFNPKGHLIASTAEDGSMRIWDVFSGAEVVTVTGLPGPRYKGLADPYHGERPCTWDREGKVVVTGAEDGSLQVWDTNGAQVLSATPHAQTITGLDVSPDNALLVSCSKDGHLKVWTMADFSPVASISLGHCLGCAFSPDGAWVAVSMYSRQGLQMVRASDWSVQMVGVGSAALNLCVAYSPTGQEVVTGGDDSSVTIWNAQNGQAVFVMRGHRGWVWCVHYNADGSRLLSCSSDRMLKLWDMASRACLVTLGGHVHRVTWACFRPGTQETFVTASLDSTLKVWDYEAVAAGRTPPTGSLHYSVLEVSPCGQYMATCQGWTKQCTLTDMGTGEVVSSAPHDGFILTGLFTHDSKLFMSLDVGHSGAYEDGATRKAQVKVSYEGGGPVTLNVSGPCAIGSSKNYIVVGTIDHTVTLFSITTGEQAHSWQAGDSTIRCIACSLTDDIIATSTTTDVKIWSVGSEHQTTLVTQLPPFENIVSHLQFSPNGKHLAAACTDGTITIWNATDRKFSQTCVLTQHSARIHSISFSLGETDDFFASSSSDMSTRVWNVAEGFKLHTVFYAPVNQVAFLKRNVIAIGESTGNKRHIEFDL